MSFIAGGIRHKNYYAAALHFNLRPQTVKYRLDAGWSVREALGLNKKRIDLRRYKAYVYVVSNSKNKKKYVGVSVSDPVLRWKRHVEAARQGKTKLHTAIRLLGATAFSVKQIAVASSPDELKILEQKFIKKFDSINKGYNSIAGGSIGSPIGQEITFKGKRFESKAALARYLGIDRKLLHMRMVRGYPIDAPISTARSAKVVKYKGKRFETKSALAEHLGISLMCLHGRLKSGSRLDNTLHQRRYL